jgi:hypothetical protein
LKFFYTKDISSSHDVFGAFVCMYMRRTNKECKFVKLCEGATLTDFELKTTHSTEANLVSKCELVTAETQFIGWNGSVEAKIGCRV